MAKLNLYDLTEEVCIRLRNADILSIATRGVSTEQDTGTFSNDSTHTLATNPTLVKNIRNVNVASADLAWGTDYTVEYTTGVITFTSPQTGAYVIDYDQGNQDRLFPDYPQAYLKRNDFPRIAVGFDSATAQDAALGGASNTWSNIRGSIICYDLSQKNVNQMASDVKEFIMDNKKVWYQVDYIRYVGFGPLLPSEFGEQKCFQRNILLEIPAIQEV